ncbi:hypothetical protein ISCGN_029350 [Ixodes scapularis]
MATVGRDQEKVPIHHCVSLFHFRSPILKPTMHSAAKVLAILFVVTIVVTNVAGGAVPAAITIRLAAPTSSPKTLAKGEEARSVDNPAQYIAKAQAQAQYNPPV